MNHYAPSSTGLLAPLSSFLEDPLISEILINKPKEVYVEKHGRMERHEVVAFDERMLLTLFQLIANENHQDIGEARPLLSGSLLDGSRVQLVLSPTAKHPALSIRRKVVQQRELGDYETEGFYDNTRHFHVEMKGILDLPAHEQALVNLYQAQKWSAFIKLAVQLKKTIIISGGTSSGKTTYLNACLRHIPLDERLVILEDTREIEAPHPNQLQLLASKGEQGVAKVTMQDLVQASLRLRPDRIIVGEIRGKEILDFLAAASTGHDGSMTSIHANNPGIAFMRMAQMVKLNNVPSMTDEDIYRELKAVIDIIVQLEKTAEGRQVQSIFYRYGSLSGT